MLNKFQWEMLYCLLWIHTENKITWTKWASWERSIWIAWKVASEHLWHKLTYSIDKPLETKSCVLHIIQTVWVGKCKAKQKTNWWSARGLFVYKPFIQRQYQPFSQLLGNFLWQLNETLHLLYFSYSTSNQTLHELIHGMGFFFLFNLIV